jgi:hypothetical protein
MRNWITLVTSITLLVAVSCISALAQYTGVGMPATGTTTSGGYTPPKSGYGSGAAIGIGLGAAAGVGVAYWALHNRPSVIGCVQQSAEGNAILNEKDGRLYHLVPKSDVAFNPGERVALRGKKTQDQPGRYSFVARKLVKDYGACDTNKANSTTTGGSK